MPLPKQPGVYADCYDIWDAAETLKVGCRTFVGPELSAAEYLRARMHQARAILRAQSRRAYPAGHPAYDTSVYDRFKISIRLDDSDNYWLYLELWGNWAAVSNIEPIPEDELGTLPNDLLEHPTNLPQRPKILELQLSKPLDNPDANRQDDLD